MTLVHLPGELDLKSSPQLSSQQSLFATLEYSFSFLEIEQEGCVTLIQNMGPVKVRA